MSGIQHLKKRNIGGMLGLSPMQAAMLFHYLAVPGSDLHVEQVCLILMGALDENLFKRAWDKVVQANEALRTVFRWEGIKQPVQIVLNEQQPEVRFLDFAARSENREAVLDAVERLKVTDRQEKFDLTKTPFRVSLARLGKGQVAMLISYHHILMDGWSLGIVLKEFFFCYGELRQAKEPLIPGKASYKDYLDFLARQGRLRVESEPVETVGRAQVVGRHSVSMGAFGRFQASRPQKFGKKLEDFCRATGVTQAALLYTAWAIVLMGYNRAREAVFAVTVSGRQAKVKGIEEMVGLLIDTLPLPVRPNAGQAFFDLVLQVNALLPGWEERAPSSQEKSLFDSLFILENYPLKGVLAPGEVDLSIESVWFSILSAYEITVMITLFEGVGLHLVYDLGRWSAEMAADLGEGFLAVVEAIMAQPGREVAESVGEMETRFAGGRAQLLVCPEEIAAGSGPGRAGYPQPRDEIEEKLHGLWAEVLHLEKGQIGIDDDFFAFKGHSLRASMLAVRVHRTFGVKVPVTEVFRRPTIRSLAEMIRGASREAFPGIEAVEKREYYPVSSVQRRFYGLQQLDESSTAYNVILVMVIEGKIDRSRFGRAFQGLVDRHESLRTSFEVKAGEPVQRVHEQLGFELEVFRADGRGGHSGQAEEGPERGAAAIPGTGMLNRIAESPQFVKPQAKLSTVLAGSEGDCCESLAPDRQLAIIQDFIRPFDLSRAPLLRVALVSLAKEEYLWLVDMHHIITDGISAALLSKDFIRLYQGEKLDPVKIQYKDFSWFQHRAIETGKFFGEREFWLTELSGELPVLNLLTDFPRPAVQSFAGDRLLLEIDEAMTGRLAGQLAKTRTTLFMFLLAALNGVFFRFTGQEDIIIGTTIAGRGQADMEGTVGLFIETLALRNFPAADRTWAEFLAEVRQRVLSTFAHQSYPFRELVRDLGLEGEKSKNPLFNVMLIVQNVDMEKISIQDLTFTPYNFRPKAAKVDLTIEVFEEGEKVAVEFEYCTDLFKRETIRRLAGCLIEVLDQVLVDETLLLKDIRLLSPGEERVLMEVSSRSDWQATGDQPPLEQVQALFKAQAESSPGQTALVMAGKHLTYQELSQRAQRLAELIRRI